ncbi:MAG: transcription termination/antitermination protein NusG [Bacteroidales bacterium]|nr:transcription termination/antitermination protein NusG [Bacteroidales bacterium]MCI2145311.1 transcription termination/antitermination protein NusG [Bacteroidales bacterium]
MVHNAPKFTADQVETIGKKWYSVRTASGKEQEAKKYIEKEVTQRHLEDYISQVLIPTEKIYTFKNGKRVQSERLFYPGYILVEANMTDEIQAIIRELPSVAGVLSDKIGNSAARLPIPLRPSEVKRILGEVDELVGQDAEMVNPFIVGEAVKIIDGPFNGFDGTIDEILEDKKKIKVIVKIFGRKTLLELNYAQVTKE